MAREFLDPSFGFLEPIDRRASLAWFGKRVLANDLGNTVRRVRMKDIAADLGLSVVTVSKVFRGPSDIGDETRGRVLARMAE